MNSRFLIGFIVVAVLLTGSVWTSFYPERRFHSAVTPFVFNVNSSDSSADNSGWIPNLSWFQNDGGFSNNPTRTSPSMPPDEFDGNIQYLTTRTYYATTPEEMKLLMREDQKNIFFILISNNGMEYKQSCAIESASRTHPEWTVYLLEIVDKAVMDRTFQHQYKRNAVPNYLLQNIYTLPNVKTIFFECEALLRDTPLEKHCTEREWDKFYLPHMSDALRLTVVYKYGGMYSDLDNVFVEEKGLEKYENIVCRETGEFINNSVMYFEKEHAFLKLVLEQFYTVNMEEQGWGYSGPKLLTKVYKECQNVSGVACENVNVLDYPTCNPYVGQGAYHFYENATLPHIKRFLKRVYSSGEILTVHLWNQVITKGWSGAEYDKRLRGRTVLLGELMYKSCQMTFNHTQDTLNRTQAESW